LKKGNASIKLRKADNDDMDTVQVRSIKNF